MKRVIGCAMLAMVLGLGVLALTGCKKEEPKPAVPAGSMQQAGAQADKADGDAAKKVEGTTAPK